MRSPRGGKAVDVAATDAASIFATNATGAILVAQAFMPLLRRGRAPRLAAISSGYGSLELNQGTPYWYGASKAALNMLHRSLAVDPAARGVTIVLMSPGWVQTDMGGASAPTTVEASVAGLMRFRVLSETGEWGGRGGFVPTVAPRS